MPIHQGTDLCFPNTERFHCPQGFGLAPQEGASTGCCWWSHWTAVEHPTPAPYLAPKESYLCRYGFYQNWSVAMQSTRGNVVLSNTLQHGSFEEIKVIQITLQYKYLKWTLAGKLCTLLTSLVNEGRGRHSSPRSPGAAPEAPTAGGRLVPVPPQLPSGFSLFSEGLSCSCAPSRYIVALGTYRQRSHGCIPSNFLSSTHKQWTGLYSHV